MRAFRTILVTQDESPRLRILSLTGWFSHSVATPWTTVAHQAPLSMGLFRPEYWSELPSPPLGDLPHPGMKPRSPALQADSLPFEPTWQSDLVNGFPLADASDKTAVLVDNLTALSRKMLIQIYATSLILDF